MHLEILVEESSMEEALNNLLPRLLPPDFSYRIIHFRGKPDLLTKLPQHLRAYRNWISSDYRIVVLVDKDQNNCLDLKQNLDKIATQAGLITKTNAGDSPFTVLNRIVVEELEAWFIGDFEALREAYPRLPDKLPRQFHDPDAVVGGTWEALERFLKRYGYYKSGYAKLEAARAISAHMDPKRNRSRSFQVFCNGLLAFC